MLKVFPATTIIVVPCIFGIMACNAEVTNTLLELNFENQLNYTWYVLTHRGVILEMTLISGVVRTSSSCLIPQSHLVLHHQHVVSTHQVVVIRSVRYHVFIWYSSM